MPDSKTVLLTSPNTMQYHIACNESNTCYLMGVIDFIQMSLVTIDLLQ